MKYIKKIAVMLTIILSLTTLMSLFIACDKVPDKKMDTISNVHITGFGDGEPKTLFGMAYNKNEFIDFNYGYINNPWTSSNKIYMIPASYYGEVKNIKVDIKLPKIMEDSYFQYVGMEAPILISKQLLQVQDIYDSTGTIRKKEFVYGAPIDYNERFGASVLKYIAYPEKNRFGTEKGYEDFEVCALKERPTEITEVKAILVAEYCGEKIYSEEVNVLNSSVMIPINKVIAKTENNDGGNKKEIKIYIEKIVSYNGME
ncbi:MAG: hypothetical protein RR348_04240, partial [Clostridia bacterium]